MSERRYAAHAGLSRGAVQKAKSSGRLVLHADGSIDAAASDKRRAETTDPAQSRRGPGLKPVPAAAVASVGETLGESEGTGGTTYLKARTANEVLKAQERRVRLARLKGELVDRDRATALVFRLARQERDAWVNWPARVAALIAADLQTALGAAATVEVAEMQRILEAHVRSHLGDLAELAIEL